jgi:hypothetical protein
VGLGLTVKATRMEKESSGMLHAGFWLVPNRRASR